MSNEENELLKLYESQYTGRLFEKANSYLLERNALFDERERLYNVLDKIKEKLHNSKEYKMAIAMELNKEQSILIDIDKLLEEIE